MKKLIFYSCCFFLILSCSENIEEEVTSVDSINTRSVPIDPLVVNGVFEFSSKQHMREFKSFIAELEEADRKALYLRLGVSSLFDTYSALEDIDENFMDHLDIYVKNESKQYILNDDLEIGINGMYYKYVRQNLIASGSVLLEVQSLGDDLIWKPGILITDRKNNQIILPDGSIPDPIRSETYTNNNGTSTTRSPCSIILSMDRQNQVSLMPFDVNYSIRVEFIDDNGETPSCSGDLTIDWGDGNTTQHSNVNIGEGGSLFNYTYDNLPEGLTIYTIIATFTPVNCVTCTSFEDASLPFIANNNPGCLNGEYDNYFTAAFWTSNGTQKKAWIGKNYDMEDWSIWDAHVGGKLYVIRKKSNGQWEDYEVKRIWISIEGYIYKEDDCSETLAFIDKTSVKTNDDCFHYEISIDDDYRANTYDNIVVSYSVFDLNTHTPVATFSTSLFNY